VGGGREANPASKEIKAKRTADRQTAVDVTGLFSLREHAIAKEPGLSYLKPWRCVSLDSVCDWWLRLLGVFPVCDFEPGRVFGLIIGDPDPATPCRARVVPVCNTDL
jgi:hypothetical protein